jgi:endonuclease III
MKQRQTSQAGPAEREKRAAGYPEPKVPSNKVAWQQTPYGQPPAPAGPDCLTVRRVVDTLADTHHTADLGNLPDPIEELVWIPLTRQTHRQNAQRSWQRIIALGGPAALLEIPEEQLADLLKDAGFSRQKARWIKRSLAMVVERFGCLSLAATSDWQDQEVESFLTTLPGIAIKSAKCVMMYSLDRDVLPVDTHLRRLSERLGWVKTGLSEKRIHHELEKIVPPDQRHSLHVNAIWHGRATCRAIKPKCEACVIASDCSKIIAPPSRRR